MARKHTFDDDEGYRVSCPVCGRFLFRSVVSETSLTCDKCNAGLAVFVKEGYVCILEKEAAGERAVQCLVSRASAYGRRISAKQKSTAS